MQLNTIFHKNVALASALASVAVSLKVNAAELQASDGSTSDNFGSAVASSNGSCLIGAPSATVDQAVDFGTCYLFRSFPTGSVLATEDVKLIPSDTDPYVLRFGESVALSGNIALITRRSTYSIYLYQNLNVASGTVTENAKIDSYRGFGISLSNVSGLLGTSLYRHLDQIIGETSPDVTLSAPDQGANDYACDTNSLSGDSALVSYIKDYPAQGGVYFYRGLSAAAGTVTPNAKLTAPNIDPSDYLGVSVSLSGSRAVVGAPYSDVEQNSDQGEAFYYRNLDTASGVVTAQTRLRANPTYLKNKDDLLIGGGVSLSGEDALINAPNGVYLYRHLDQAGGTIYEDVNLYASIKSDNPRLNSFGDTFNLDGDRFVVTDPGTDLNTGAVYTGSVSALTTNDFGNSRKVAAYVSFISHLDWIAGETTDNNQIPLAAGDTATVKDAGKAVYIGKNAGSDNNLLDIAGTLNATYVYIGSTAGNTGNTLQVESTGKITASALRLATGNRLLIAGTPAAAKTFLQKAPLQVWVAGAWKTVTPANYRSLVKISQANGFTVVVPAG